MLDEDVLDSHPQGIEDCLRLAKSGSSPAINQLLKICHSYLLLVANRELDADLRAKVSPSDLVQDSLFEIHRDFSHYNGVVGEEFFGWIRRILLNNVAEVRGRYRGTLKRDLNREVSLESLFELSQKEGFARHDSSQLTKLVNHERKKAVEQAIDQLPEEYRMALLLRHREGYTFEEIGLKIGKSSDAVRKLWARAVEQLKRDLRPLLTHDGN